MFQKKRDQDSCAIPSYRAESYIMLEARLCAYTYTVHTIERRWLCEAPRKRKKIGKCFNYGRSHNSRIVIYILQHSFVLILFTIYPTGQSDPYPEVLLLIIDVLTTLTKYHVFTW